jgi:hypothetical protein
MTQLVSDLRARLANLEARPWASALTRLLLTFLVLFPWGYRFIQVPFRAEDIDPVLLEACRAEGLDILNPAAWPSLGQVWRHWTFTVLGLALAWWLLSRLLRALQRRWGMRVALVVLVVGAVPMWVPRMVWSLTQRVFSEVSWSTYRGSIAVWGGWLEGRTFTSGGLADAIQGLAFLLLVWEGLGLASRTQALLSEAKARILRARLAPHFLYNALANLQGLVDEDPKGAQSGLERLGRLLRRLMEASDVPKVRLDAELAFTEDYLGLERARLGDRLRVRLEVPEEMAACLVPVLGLQVLVENAVKHAIAPRAEGGELVIRATRDGNWLTVAVEDPGSGTSSKPGLGSALENLRSRLLRDDHLRLELIPEGHRASFRVPCEVG